jgi:hypothetical protein
MDLLLKRRIFAAINSSALLARICARVGVTPDELLRPPERPQHRSGEIKNLFSV